jgi:hypothetical protein
MRLQSGKQHNTGQRKYIYIDTSQKIKKKLTISVVSNSF